MSCLSCPKGSTTITADSDPTKKAASVDDCICNTGSYRFIHGKNAGMPSLSGVHECQVCPVNSQIKQQDGLVGNSSSSCLCNAGFFSVAEDNDRMSCAKCPPGSSSEVGSTGIEACTCKERDSISVVVGSDSMSCVQCSDDKTSPLGSNTCACKKGNGRDADGFYLSDPSKIGVVSISHHVYFSFMPFFFFFFLFLFFSHPEHCDMCADDIFFSLSSLSSLSSLFSLSSSRFFCFVLFSSHFLFFVKTASETCAECIHGANCSVHDNAVLSNLTAQPGYWHPSPDSPEFLSCADAMGTSNQAKVLAESRCCPLDIYGTSICLSVNLHMSSSDAQCSEGYGGPVCMACVNETFTMSNGVCTKCDGGASTSSVVNFLLGVVSIFFLIFFVLFMRADIESEDKKKQKDLNKKQKKKQMHTNAAARLVGDQVQIGRLPGNNDEGSKGIADTDNEAFRSDSQVVVDRIKVFYSWLQIFVTMTMTFQLAWPVQLKSMSLGLSFVNFDIGNIMGGSNCSFAISYLAKFTIHMFFPGILILLILLSSIPAHFLRKKETQRRSQHALRMKSISALLLIVYPGICVRLFSVLKCTTIRGLDSVGTGHTGNVMVMAYDVECWTGAHSDAVTLAIVCIVLWVIGIPAFVFFLLIMNKKTLYITKEATKKDIEKHEDSVAEYGGLYLQCACFYGCFVCFFCSILFRNLNRLL